MKHRCPKDETALSRSAAVLASGEHVRLAARTVSAPIPPHVSCARLSSVDVLDGRRNKERKAAPHRRPMQAHERTSSNACAAPSSVPIPNLGAALLTFVLKTFEQFTFFSVLLGIKSLIFWSTNTWAALSMSLERLGSVIG